MAETKTVSRPVEQNQEPVAVDRAKDFWSRYNRPITMAALAIILLGGGYLAYKNFVQKPNEQKASEAIFKAEEYYRLDSFRLALNGDGVNQGFVKLADGYEMPADTIDGMSAEAVHEGVSRAVKRAREGGGPTLLEIKTYRYKGHSISDPQKYRTKEEVEEYKGKDPITALLQTIKENKFATDDEIAEINRRVDQAVEESVKFAEESPWPSDDEVLKDVYVDQNYPFIVD